MNSYAKLAVFAVVFITIVLGAIYVYKDLKKEYYEVKKEYIQAEKAKAMGGMGQGLFKGMLPFGGK